MCQQTTLSRLEKLAQKWHGKKSSTSGRTIPQLIPNVQMQVELLEDICPIRALAEQKINRLHPGGPNNRMSQMLCDSEC